MSYRSDSAEAEAGRRGEAIVRQWAIRQRWLVLEASSIGSGATMFRQNGKTIALDQLHIKEGVSRWVDVKWKRAPIGWRNRGGILRHGIDLPNWRDYLTIWKQSGSEACLAIVEVKRARNNEEPISPRLLWQSFRLLEIRVDVVSSPSEPFPRGAAWWDRADFDDLGPIPIGTGSIPDTQLNLRPWEDPMLGIPYVERDAVDGKRRIERLIHKRRWEGPWPDEAEKNRRLERDRALQEWHTKAIPGSFEDYWKGRKET